MSIQTNFERWEEKYNTDLYDITDRVGYTVIKPNTQWFPENSKDKTERENLITQLIPVIYPIVLKYDYGFNYKHNVHLDKKHCLDISYIIDLPNGKIVGVDSRYSCIKFWDSKTGRCECILMIDFFSRFICSYDNKLVTASLYGKKIKIWNTEEHKIIKIVDLGSDKENDISSKYDHQDKYERFDEYEEERISALIIQKIKDVDYIVIGTSKGNVRLWNTLTEKWEDKIYPKKKECTQNIIFINDEQFIVSYGGQKLYFWNIQENDYSFKINIKRYILNDRVICILPENKIACGYDNNKIAIIDLINQEIEMVYEGNHLSSSRIKSILLLENTIMSVSNKNSIEIWNYETGQWVGGYICDSPIQSVYKLPNDNVIVKFKNKMAIMKENKIVKEIFDVKEGNNMLLLLDNRILIYDDNGMEIFK